MYPGAYQVSGFGKPAKAKTLLTPRYRYLYSGLELKPEEVSEVSSREPVISRSLEPCLLSIAFDNAFHEIHSSSVELSRGSESKRNEGNFPPFFLSNLPQNQLVEQNVLLPLPHFYGL